MSDDDDAGGCLVLGVLIVGLVGVFLLVVFRVW